MALIRLYQEKDGIHAQNKDDSSSGFVYLAGGTYTISAGDDGIHAASNVTISDGKIDITQSYEGIEGLSIDIAGGEISVLASDDGINAAGGTIVVVLKDSRAETTSSHPQKAPIFKFLAVCFI